MNRRAFLGCLGVATLLPFPVLADDSSISRELTLQRGSIVETIQYIFDGRASREAYSKICWMLRDVRTEKMAAMDPVLLEMLAWLQSYARQFGFTGAIQILSGYRSRSTNALDGGASNSYHLVGQAIDFRLPGVSTKSLGKVVAALQVGGAGIYLKDDFVHADTGDLRVWRA